MVIFRERWDGNIFFCKNHQQQWFFDGFGVTQPSPLTDFQPPDHCFQCFFRWFWGHSTIALIVFNGHGPTMRWF